MNSSEAKILLESGPDGVAEWNHLRKSGKQEPLRIELHSDLYDPFYEPLDLRGVDLGGCSVAGCKLEGVDLTGAHLYRTDFSHSFLTRSKLVKAHLFGAKLDEANIEGACLDRANLCEATLRRVRGPASFCGARLERADLTEANLARSDFVGAHMRESNLYYSNLTDSKLDKVDFSAACLQEARLTTTSLAGAYLDGADLRAAWLDGAILQEARMIDTRLEGAILNGSSVYGISAWDLMTDKHTQQRDLNIGRHGEAVISVDDLEVAQFLYLLMNNSRLRGVIDTITSKVVLVLGRFSKDRKPVLDALREALRGEDFQYVPIVFDFSSPTSRTTAETVATLAGMARFVIADLTDAKSVLQELREIVPGMPSLPVQPLLLDSQQEPGMLDYFQRYPWFLKTCLYSDKDDLLNRLAEVVEPAVNMSSEIRGDDPLTTGGDTA